MKINEDCTSQFTEISYFTNRYLNPSSNQYRIRNGKLSMELERVDNGKVTIFSFREEDQLREPDALASAINEAIMQKRYSLLIDMGNVTYISSSVLGLFITTMRDLNEKQGAIKLLNPQPSVSNVLRMTRLDRVFEMFNDRETALKSFQ